MPNVNLKEARFVHPSEFGMSFPVNTPKELTQIARAMNGGMARSQSQYVQPSKPQYKVVK